MCKDTSTIPSSSNNKKNNNSKSIDNKETPGRVVTPPISTSVSPAFSKNASMAELVDQYDGFILDQYGVLHNGVTGLPGAPEAVSKLYAMGKRLVILSNSSASSVTCQAKLPALGYDPSQFVGTVTSGQEAAEFIERNCKKPTKVLFLTWKTPRTPSPLLFLELCGPNITVTDDPQQADLVILHGVDVLRGPGLDGEATEHPLGNFMVTGNMDRIDPILQECADRQLPMICANPDFVMVRPDGSIGHMHGKIADRYENHYGGHVISFGKPHKEHFQACLEKLQLPKHKVAHVGDSLVHDVAGANATGVASIFITSGIHRQELQVELGEMPTTDALETLFEKNSQTPTHVMPLFRF
ncbi:HAD-superfamily hydrolase [Nitzschia inconspicua]|uniref:HAD-superfamily hydrolase n=1 Tax=Nitzschia inconspicua TaxID=303405 RepID=A0A9K3PSI4_9STRA|nr:HAD-superfamily hydrolase [Nitzschia inconspicua]